MLCLLYHIDIKKHGAVMSIFRKEVLKVKFFQNLGFKSFRLYELMLKIYQTV